ncbi:TPA: hypothetical protein ACID0C_001841 [Pseudomonas aeruginosa]
MTNANECTCPSGDGSLRHPCPAHPESVELAGLAAKLTFINGRPAMCGCQVEYSSGGGEYSDVIYVTLCAKHSGSAILDLVATNRIALTPEYEGQWHADLYLDREIPLAKAEGATPAEAVLALMSAERIDPEQESVEQAGGDERVKCAVCVDSGKVYDISGEGPWKCYACTGSHEVIGYANGDELDNMLDDRTAVLSPVKTSFHTVPVYREARAALAQPSPGQAEAERPEVVGYRVSMPDEPELGHWLEEEAESEPQIQHHEPLMTVAQHERIVEALRFERQQMDRAFTACINERDAANARLHEVATACATAEQERDAALDKISKLESRWPHGESPEERFEHYISNTIDRAPEPLRRLGNWLSHVLDEDQWTTAERMLTGACVAAEERAAEQTQHSVPEGWMLVPVEPLLNMMSDKDHDTRITAERQLLSILAAAPGKEVPQAWIDVQEERRRQITAEGWTPEHDDLYCAAELPRAAAAYILNGANDEAPAIWPFVAKWWKPRDARSNYVRAGALILAEIERLDRAAPGKEVGHE